MEGFFMPETTQIHPDKVRAFRATDYRKFFSSVLATDFSVTLVAILAAGGVVFLLAVMGQAPGAAAELGVSSLN
jgi:hypothetical protein